MRAYRGGEKVKPGIYFQPRRLSFKSMATEDCLPGTEKDVYRHVPTLALVLAGPLLGGLYVVFLPLAGFALLAWFTSRKAMEVGAQAARASVRVVRPAWEPARAFLSRNKRGEGGRRCRDKWAAEVEGELRAAEAADEKRPGGDGPGPGD